MWTHKPRQETSIIITLNWTDRQLRHVIWLKAQQVIHFRKSVSWLILPKVQGASIKCIKTVQLLQHNLHLHIRISAMPFLSQTYHLWEQTLSIFQLLNREYQQGQVCNYQRCLIYQLCPQWQPLITERWSMTTVKHKESTETTLWLALLTGLCCWENGTAIYNFNAIV